MPPPNYYHKGQRPDTVFNQYAGFNKLNRYFYLKVGRVVDTNLSQYTMKIEWVGGEGSPEWMPISFAYVGPGSCIGTVPEYGSLVICGYMNKGQGPGVALPLVYLPVSLQAALEHNSLKQYPDSISTSEDNLFFMKFRKLSEGDVIVTSKFGGEIFVNKDVEIKDGLRDTILMRGLDHVIAATSLNNFIFSGGVSVNAGHVIRNKVNLFDSQGNRLPNVAREKIFPDGRVNVYYTPFGDPIQENSQFYSEYRIDADELHNGFLETNDINSQTVLSNNNPIVSLILGNYVGANENQNYYGKILRPMLFKNSEDSEGQFNLIECVQNKGVDEITKLGMAFAVHMLKNNSLFAFDKEGHCYLNLNSSTSANPLGAGRSMSVRGTGNLKEIWGQAADDGNSWDLSTTGGMRWNIGKHNARGNDRSVFISTTSGYRLDVKGSSTEITDPDLKTDSFARTENIYGNQKVVIGGSDKKTVNGDSMLFVSGLRKEQIIGAASYEYQKDKSENCLGVYTQTVMKEMQGRFTKRVETVYLGQELTVMTGDMVETIKTFGNKKTTLTLGNIEETIIKGDRKVTILVGKYSVTVAAGGIDIKATGTTKLTGLAGVTIQGLKTDINSATVNLGAIPLKGGVVTGLPVPSHLDYMTGLPLKGSATVKASI